MLQYTSFVYGGIPSSDYGIVCANPSDGLFQETFIADQTIVEVIIPGRSKPYYQDTTTSPLSFPLKLWFSDPTILQGNTDSDFNDNKLEEIARWLSPNFYQPFYFEDNPDKVYYCKPNQSAQLVHNGLQQGYLTLTMRCDDSVAYSPTVMSDIYDLSSNPNGTDIVLENRGSLDIYPQMWITKVGNGSITITNNTNGGELITINNLSDGETIFIDGDEEIIQSDIPGIVHYDDMSGDYISLVYGNNNINVVGNCQLQFKIEFKYKNAII